VTVSQSESCGRDGKGNVHVRASNPTLGVHSIAIYIYIKLSGLNTAFEIRVVIVLLIMEIFVRNK
jgi:hypothetical protein